MESDPGRAATHQSSLVMEDWDIIERCAEEQFNVELTSDGSRSRDNDDSTAEDYPFMTNGNGMVRVARAVEEQQLGTDDVMNAVRISKESPSRSEDHNQNRVFVMRKAIILGLSSLLFGTSLSAVSASSYGNWSWIAIKAVYVGSHIFASCGAIVLSSVPSKIFNLDLLMDAKRDTTPFSPFKARYFIHVITLAIMIYSSYLYFVVPPFFPGVILFAASAAFLFPHIKYTESWLGYIISPVVANTAAGKIAAVPRIAALVLVISGAWNIKERESYIATCLTSEWMCNEGYWDYTSNPEWVRIQDFVFFFFGLYYMQDFIRQKCNAHAVAGDTSDEATYAVAYELFYTTINIYQRTYALTMIFWGISYMSFVDQMLGLTYLLGAIASLLLQFTLVACGKEMLYKTVGGSVAYIYGVDLETASDVERSDAVSMSSNNTGIETESSAGGTLRSE
jgi:hypothetical protein